MHTVVTHDGNFHPDDVFAVATLELAFGDVNVIRSRNEEVVGHGDFVVDVGGEYDAEGGRFDHHQAGGAGERENGIQYASFGLVWKHFGERLCGGNKEVSELIDRRLVQPIDANDNGMDLSQPHFEGVTEYTLGDMAWIFRPTWKEEGNQDDMFLEAVALAKKLLKREIKANVDNSEGYEFVREAYEKAEDKRVIVLEENYPWMEVLIEYPEPLFCVKPNDDGKWGAKAVRKSLSSFENRASFPEEWGGKSTEELQELTGVEDVIFAHRAGFLVGAGSKEGALALAMLALQ